MLEEHLPCLSGDPPSQQLRRTGEDGLWENLYAKAAAKAAGELLDEAISQGLGRPESRREGGPPLSAQLDEA